MNTKISISVRPLLLSSTMIVAALTASLSQAQTISDDFQRDASKFGSALNGNVTSVGGVTWEVFGEDTPVYNAAAAGPTEFVTMANLSGGDKVSLSSIGSEDSLFTLSADFDSQGIGTGYVALLFSAELGTPHEASDLWMIMNANGGYQVLKDGANVIADGYASAGPDFNASGFNHLSMVYDSEVNTVSASFNGSSVLSDFDLGAYTPSLNYAGFYFLKGADGVAYTPKVDNFSVSAIPEASTFAYVVGIVLLGGVYSTRRRRFIK